MTTRKLQDYHDDEDLRTEISTLNHSELVSLLTRAAKTYPPIHQAITNALSARRARESARVLTFDWMSRSIWHTINRKYSTLSGSKQYDISGEVADEINECIEDLVSQCGSYASPGTRYNGLSVLRKIGKTICLSGGDTLGHEVQLRFQWDWSLEDGMLRILEAMDVDERIWIREGNDEGGQALWAKLVELRGLAEGRCLFPGFERVLHEIATAGCEEDEEEEEEKDESEYGEDDEEGGGRPL